MLLRTFARMSRRFASLDELDTHPDFLPKIKKEPYNPRKAIEELVFSSKMVVFMKGTPDDPKCDSSKFVVNTLKQHKVDDYQTVNVLVNGLIHDDVKKLTNHQSFPQLFVDGGFVGGHDLVSDMVKNNTFKDFLMKKGILKE